MTKKKTTKKITKKTTKKSTLVGQPRVEIIGAEVDPKKGMKIELDWNDEFVEYLRRNGYTGVTDEAIVQKWLGQLYGQLMQDINPKKNSDYE